MQAAEREAWEQQQQQLASSIGSGDGGASGDEGAYENRVVLDYDLTGQGNYPRPGSLRMSFFDKFGDSRLSEILEFEEDGDLETISESFCIDSRENSPSCQSSL